MKPISLSTYKELYFNNTKDCIPGEHHFVAVYLLNKFDMIPDYLNPDGMKGALPGDIGFRKGNKTLSIEVKLGKKNCMSSISFTASQYEKWFIKSEEVPDYLIVLIKNSFFVINFNKFIAVYKTKYWSKIEEFKKKTGSKKNGPSLSEECIETCCDKSNEKFNLSDEEHISAYFDKINKEISSL